MVLSLRSRPISFEVCETAIFDLAPSPSARVTGDSEVKVSYGSVPTIDWSGQLLVVVGYSVEKHFCELFRIDEYAPLYFSSRWVGRRSMRNSETILDM